ncbi:MAG: hypothetical protein FWC68_04575 [Oscillospiraceae bacterium]|nr:hypothetical protein [Oscillospiraceae bacterium]
MCGIVGYIGYKKADNILINGLAKLEYRGYDSCGITTLEKDGHLLNLKTKGRVAELDELVQEEKLEATTRNWSYKMGNSRETIS